MLGDLISGGFKLVQGLMGKNEAQEGRQFNKDMANQEYERQKEFAQSGIKWRVQDAQSAGVHPLFALGASTSSYAPQSIGFEKSGLGSALGDMGQDVGRAVNATMSKPEREQMAISNGLKLESMKLDNDIKRATLASELRKNAAAPAVGPGIPEEDASKRPKLHSPEGRIPTNPKVSNAEDFEKRYGEMSDFIYGPQIWMRDELDRAGGYELNQKLRKVFQWLGVLN